MEMSEELKELARAYLKGIRENAVDMRAERKALLEAMDAAQPFSCPVLVLDGKAIVRVGDLHGLGYHLEVKNALIG